MEVAELFNQKAEGKLTMNQVYLNAVGEGKFKGSFKTFMAKAQDAGLIDKGLGWVSSALHNKFDPVQEEIPPVPCPDGYIRNDVGGCDPIKTGMSTPIKIAIGASAVLLIGTIIYLSMRKSD